MPDLGRRPHAGSAERVVSVRAVTPDDAALIHAVYLTTPGYFDMISIPVPSADEVAVELRAAADDERRHVELLLTLPSEAPESLRDPSSGDAVVGILDYKVDYPDAGDATVNLVLIHGALQGRGYGAAAVRSVEARLRGRVGRLLAAVYGRNPVACRFWERQGYRFAIDARPLLDWYAKEIA
jgi:GNAT superfamily N-acetyltransferase